MSNMSQYIGCRHICLGLWARLSHHVYTYLVATRKYLSDVSRNCLTTVATCRRACTNVAPIIGYVVVVVPVAVWRIFLPNRLFSSSVMSAIFSISLPYLAHCICTCWRFNRQSGINPIYILDCIWV